MVLYAARARRRAPGRVATLTDIGIDQFLGSTGASTPYDTAFA